MLLRLLTVLTVWLISAACAAASVTGSATILSLEGKGEYRVSATAAWQAARVNQQLLPGQSIRSGSHSRIALVLSDRTQIRLNENTQIDIIAAQPAPRTAGQSKFRQVSGRAWVQSRTPPRELQWETPTATAGIRGTDWEMEVAEEGRSTLSVFSGEVEFYNELGRVTVQANEQAVVEKGRAPVKLVVQNLWDRVQWVTAYHVDPLRHVVLAGDSLPDLRDELSQTSADDPASRVRRGRILADLGRWQQAEKEFAAAQQARPDDNDAMIGLAYASLRRGDVDAAGKWLAQARAAQETEAWVYADIGRMLLEQDIAGAIAALQTAAQRTDLAQPTAWLLLSDLMLYEGRSEAALEAIREGMRRFPTHHRLYAQLARLYLFTDRSPAAATAAEQAIDSDLASFEGWLARADIARREGDAEIALPAYDLAIALKPDDDRAWYGRGAAQSEREYVHLARTDLATALALNPLGIGYQGEKGTLETFANEYADAEAAYRAALAANPADFVALTGLGLLELKRGHTQQALDAFLKAGVMEPRYARVHVYTAAAYYQMGEVVPARGELAKAIELDDKDPLPHFMAAIIESDQLRPADAIDSARRALQRLPYLKSLNQLANDQQGSANLGQAFAFFGMEEWARSYAQESYSPFWAGSHLFLADRYNGLFTKNSELFQGFLSDPTVFGASTRFRQLVPAPTTNLDLSLRYTASDSLNGFSPQAQFSGYRAEPKPLAWYLGYEGVNWDLLDRPYDLDVFTAAFGVKPSFDTGLFLFADAAKQESHPSGTTADGFDFDLNDDLDTRRLDVGFNYKPSPVSQIWVKAGYFDSLENTDGVMDVVFYDFDGFGTEYTDRLIKAETDVTLPEFAFRHSFEAEGGHQISWGLDYARRQTDSYITADIPPIIEDFYIQRTDVQLREHSLAVYVSDTFSLRSDLTLQGDLFYQNHRSKASALLTDTYGLFGDTYISVHDPAPLEVQQDKQLSPRLGLVYRPNEQARLRFAYQNWIRPAGMSSLGPVATAGIPLDDRLVRRGGELNRFRLQGEWEARQDTFLMGYLDYKEIDNNRLSIQPFAVNELESLNKLRPRDYGQLMRDDLYEFIDAPDYAGGTVKSGGISVNHMLTRQWSLTGRYIYTDSENSENPRKEIPYLAAHTLAAGATWVNPRGWYVAGLLAYRSRRFSDETNTDILKSSFSGDLDVFWESRDKHWLMRFSASDLYDENQDAQYTGEVNYRF